MVSSINWTLIIVTNVFEFYQNSKFTVLSTQKKQGCDHGHRLSQIKRLIWKVLRYLYGGDNMPIMGPNGPMDPGGMTAGQMANMPVDGFAGATAGDLAAMPPAAMGGMNVT